MVRLGDLIEQIRGVSYKPEDVYDKLRESCITLLRANNIKDGQLNFDDVVFVDKKRVHDNQLLRAGDILICTSSGSKELVGKAAYVQEDLQMTFGAFCKVVRPKKIRSDYLGHFFNSPNYRQKISDSSAGANINNIRNEHIDELQISLPTADRQKFIASVLDKLTSLIFLRKQQLAKLDELVKARFVEMFGNVENVRFLETVASVTGGLTKNSKRNELSLKLPYLRVANVFYDNIDTTKILEIGLAQEERDKTLLKYGDLLFVEGNGSPDQIGRVAIWRDEVVPCVHQNHLIKVRFDESQILPIYAMHYYMSPKGREQIKSKAVSTSGLYTLSVSKIENLFIPVVPIEQQRRFSSFVEQVNKQKLKIQQSLDKLEVLKKSLMQEYFG